MRGGVGGLMRGWSWEADEGWGWGADEGLVLGS